MAKSPKSNRRARPQRRTSEPRSQPVHKGDHRMTEKTKTTEQTSVSSKPAEKKPAPLTFTVNPTSGPEQTSLTISGADFRDIPGRLMLHDVQAPALTWTNEAIQTIVPYGAAAGIATDKTEISGDLVVTTVDGRTGTSPFTVTKD